MYKYCEKSEGCSVERMVDKKYMMLQTQNTVVLHDVVYSIISFFSFILKVLKVFHVLHRV